jgi:predicted RND superfamily exporter protein
LKKFAELLIKNRITFLIITGLITVFFIFELSELTVKTNFADLLPQNHPFIKVHNKIRNIFGGANQVLIMVQVRKGNIFNKETLKKVQWITYELEKIPGVDPYKISSIAISKKKTFKFTSGTMSIKPLMYPDIPKNKKEMDELRDNIYSNPRYYGPYVSYDSKKTLIMVDFFEKDVDYRTVFNELSRIREHTEDENHIINIAGEPMHLGYINYHNRGVVIILAVTVLAILFILYFYFHSLQGVIIPFVSGIVSGIWGIGIMSMMGYSLDPLILVVPFLLALMTVRHAMQKLVRYTEEFLIVGDGKLAARNVVIAMFRAGITGIITDSLGIALVAIAAIPILQKVSVVCALWAIPTLIIALLLTPVLLSFIPVSEKLKTQYEARKEMESGSGLLDRILTGLGRWIPQRGKWYVAAITVIIVTVGFNYAKQIKVGDFMPGSSILWPFHRYNKDAFRITFSMPLLNPMYVILEDVEGYESETGGFCTRASTLREMDNFRRYMMKHDRVMFASSIVNFAPSFMMSMHEDDPQCYHLPRDDRALHFITRRMLYSGEPGTWDKYVHVEEKFANIVIYCRDKMPKTIESIMGHIEAYLAETPGAPGGKYRLAGGAVGVQAGVREVIADAQIWNLIFALGGIFLFCAINFRSVTAGLILTIPLAVSNILTFALMGAYQIGLTVNTYPVASIGIGLGVDYGIYFMSRLLEEREGGADLNKAVLQTLRSNGRAIIMIATTLTIGLIIWIFSPLKFQAEMGALLAILLFLNMLGALLLVPAMICILKPKFAADMQPEK